MNLIRWLLLAFLGMLLTVISFHFFAVLEYWHIPLKSFTKVESVHSILIDKIESYQSVEEIEKYLRSHSLRYSKESETPSTGSRPPFRIDTLKVKNYRHLGNDGELLLQFFNNRLMEALFFPSDKSNYLMQLEADGIRIPHNKEVKFDKYTVICAGQNSDGRDYVSWRDKRLRDEMSLWIKRYS